MYTNRQPDKRGLEILFILTADCVRRMEESAAAAAVVWQKASGFGGEQGKTSVTGRMFLFVFQQSLECAVATAVPTGT